MLSKKMPFFKAVFCIQIILFMIHPAMAGQKTTIIGEAYDLKTGKFVFREKRIETSHEGLMQSVNVSFFDSANHLFATEASEVVTNPFTPNLIFRDTRDDRLEQVDLTRENVTVTFRPKSGNELTKKSFANRENMATVPGIKNLILAKWDLLQKGESLSVRLVIPSEKDYFTFNVQKTASVSINGEPADVFKIYTSSIMLRLLTHPLYLTIGSKTKRLYQYEGIHFIREEQTWQGSRVRIIYRY